jgi:hypothetical protein
MLLTLAALLLSGPGATAARPGMPPEVAAHYRDYNFVNAFSSRTERRVLAESGTAPTERRLAQVARALARLAERTEELDPGIVLQGGAHGDRPRHESEFRSGIVRVTAWHADDAKGEAWVELEVMVLEEATVGLFVADYDRLTQRGKSMPDLDALLAVARRLPLQTLETHRWLRIDGEWRRAAAVLILTPR